MHLSKVMASVFRRHTDKQTNIQTDKQTERQTDKQTWLKLFAPDLSIWSHKKELERIQSVT